MIFLRKMNTRINHLWGKIMRENLIVARIAKKRQLVYYVSLIDLSIKALTSSKSRYDASNPSGELLYS